MTQFVPNSPLRSPIITEKGDTAYFSRARGWADWFRQIADALNGTVRQQTGVLPVDTNPGLAYGHDNLTDVPGLSADLLAGHWYGFRIILQIEASLVGGYKWKVTGTAVPYNAVCQMNVLKNDPSDASAGSLVMNGVQSSTTALDFSFGAAGSSSPTEIWAELVGTIHVLTAGTLKVQFAQNAVSGTTYLGCGSSLHVWEIS